MRQGAEYRKERIERLFHELQYEITRGMMEGEIEETLGFEFIVSVSRVQPKGVVRCRFDAFPVDRYWLSPDEKPIIKLVAGNS